MGATPKDISASRGAAILGMSDWATPVSTWLKIMEERKTGFCKKHGYIFPEWEDSAPARWGLAFEDAICDLAQGALDGRITNREKSYSHDDYPFITCHVDGELVDPPHARAVPRVMLVENKTTNIRSYRDKWGEPGTDHIPSIYQIQVQQQMMCAGMDECVVNVLVFPKMVDEFEESGKTLYTHDENGGVIHGNTDVHSWADLLADMGYFHQYPIKANPELQAKMLEGYVKFWEENVLAEKPPGPIRYDDIKALVKEPRGTIVASDQTWRWAKEYKDIGAEISAANKRRAELKTKLLAEMAAGAPHPIDDESVEKWILRSPDGHKLVSWNGKTFR